MKQRIRKRNQILKTLEETKKVYIGATLTVKQLEICEKITKDDAPLYHCICCSRQFGKTYMLMQLCLYYALNNPQWQLMFVSMTYPQVQKVMNEMWVAIRGTDVVKHYSKADCEIEFCNGSILRFRSYQNPDSCRGYTSHLLVIDEAAFMADGDFNTIFRPHFTTTSNIGRCILASTPRSRNWFYDFYTKGNAKYEKKYRSYKATWKDNPFASVDEIEDARKAMPLKIFQQEYEAEFVKDSMSVFTNVDNCISNNMVKSATRYFAGVDVGRQDDFTVLTIMDNNGQVVYINRWNMANWDDIANNIANVLNRYMGRIVVYQETNGIGDVFYEILEKKLKSFRIPLYSWTTTNQTKIDVIEALIYAFNNNEISIPNDEELLNELDAYECSFSKQSRCITYNGRQGIHDDMVMSLAIANYQKRNNASSGHYSIK